jgi:hypothetical protein
MNAAQRPSADVVLDPYTTLVLAIVHRAVKDASGFCDSPGYSTPEKIESEARCWLADTQAVRDLLELAGFDASPVLRRLGALQADAALADNSYTVKPL